MYAKELRERVLDALEAIKTEGRQWLDEQREHPQIKPLYKAIENGLYTGCLKVEELREAETAYQERVKVPQLQDQLDYLRGEVALLKKRARGIEKEVEEGHWLGSGLDTVDLPPHKSLKEPRIKPRDMGNAQALIDDEGSYDEGSVLLKP